MKVQFSIRYKFLAVSTALLVLCVGAYLWLATKEFSEDKKSLVYDYQKSIVVNVGRDVERLVQGLRDRLQIAVLLQARMNSQNAKMTSELFDAGGDVAFAALTRADNSIERPLYVNDKYFQAYEFSAELVEKQILNSRPVPFEELAAQGEVLWNATVFNGPPLLGFARAVIVENDQGVPVAQYTVVALFKADRLLKSLEQGDLSEVVVVRHDGQILVHSNEKLMREGLKFDDEMLNRAALEKDRIKISSYFSKSENYLGGYAKVLQDKVIVLSRVTEKRAFHAVYRLLFRSLLFASTILTLAFIVAILFSRTLTRPLDALMGGMKKVSDGDLQIHIDVKTKDELALLALSFNQMIQDLRNSREELENINRELENKVRERTRQLESQNLAVKEAQEALLRSTRLAAVGEVAGQAAHQVLNPLTSIISRLRKLRERMNNERQKEIELLLDIEKSWKKEYLEGGFKKLTQTWTATSQVNPNSTLWDEDLQNMKAIGENTLQEYQTLISDTDFLIGESERISRIVNSFRSLSTVRGEIKRHSVHRLCEQSLKIMADLALKENIELKYVPAESDIHVQIDEDEFIQVMTNLVRNSLHAVNARVDKSIKGQIVLQTKVLSTSQSEVVQLSIRDNGVGIPSQYHKQLFEKNFTTKNRSEGTGIGLSISRRLIRAFQGDIQLLQSVPNGGTEFLIQLPMAPSLDAKKGVA